MLINNKIHIFGEDFDKVSCSLDEMMDFRPQDFVLHWILDPITNTITKDTESGFYSDVGSRRGNG